MFMCCPFLTSVYVMWRLLLGATLAPFWGDIIEYDLIGSLFLLLQKFADLKPNSKIYERWKNDCWYK